MDFYHNKCHTPPPFEISHLLSGRSGGGVFCGVQNLGLWLKGSASEKTIAKMTVPPLGGYLASTTKCTPQFIGSNSVTRF